MPPVFFEKIFQSNFVVTLNYLYCVYKIKTKKTVIKLRSEF